MEREKAIDRQMGLGETERGGGGEVKGENTTRL